MSRIYSRSGNPLPLSLCLAMALLAGARAEPIAPSEQFQARLKAVNASALRQAVEDLAATFPNTYPRGPEFLHALSQSEAEVGKIADALAQGDSAALGKAQDFIVALETLQRDALVANPLVSGHPILFVARKQYNPDHHNTETLFQAGEINTASFEGGAALKAIDFGHGAAETTLVAAPQGEIRDPDVYFDASRLVFSMRNDINDAYSIYEVRVDGANLRRLTQAPGVSDVDPLYLPDDSIAFSSTREPKYCMCNRHIMANLFRMEPDGAGIHQIGKSTLFEGHGSLMPDGRILYYRWEYVDRNFGDAQGLWTVNPDGTQHAVYWGNNTPSPGAVVDPRVIPGAEQVLCTFTSCHDRPWGAIAIVDRRMAMDGPRGVVRIWPAGAKGLVKDAGPDVGYAFDDFKQVNPKYEDPYPLSDKYFLCSRVVHDETMGIFLIDIFGNELLLHVEEPGCFDPMPLAPHPRPLAIAPRRNFDNQAGSFYVADVYRGTHMAGVARGAVKYLRVVESPEKRFWTNPSWNGQGQMAPAMNWHDFNNKRILGTVPVEADGSAHVAVPSDTYVYFQLLDENGMMIQSMRSGTIVQSGEQIGCIGCHEERRTAPPLVCGDAEAAYGSAKGAADAMPAALRRPPSRLDGWYGPPRLFSFMAEVQPVFDAHCVRCHDFGKKAGEKLVLARDRTLTFNASYNELWRKRMIKAVGAGPAQFLPAYSWGARSSRLIEVLRKGHHDVHLTAEELDRLATWIDINAPYYPEYASIYPDNLAGRSPLDPKQLQRLSALTATPLADLADWQKNRGPDVSFDRPKLSPILATFADTSDPNYREALAIIQAGKELLARRPPDDVPGFVLEGADAQRQAKYDSRRRIEATNRQAIREGRKVYDEPR